MRQKKLWMFVVVAGVLWPTGCMKDVHKSGIAAETSSPSAISVAVQQFTDSTVPTRGPAESEPIPRNWPEPTTVPSLPGNGLARHPMLYAGEEYNTIFLVKDGKVVWTYSAGKRGEIDDVWLETNGHILFANQFGVTEITPKKEVVWHYDPPPGTEVHTCQPIGLDKVFLVQNALPPKLMIINKKSNSVEVEHELPAESLTDPKTSFAVPASRPVARTSLHS